MHVHWSIKQIEGSADWGVGSHFANWISVGLNHQAIHHLFPSMTHWVYPQLAPVVE
jgi:fatty acid desaturase